MKLELDLLNALGAFEDVKIFVSGLKSIRSVRSLNATKYFDFNWQGDRRDILIMSRQKVVYGTSDYSEGLMGVCWMKGSSNEFNFHERSLLLGDSAFDCPTERFRVQEKAAQSIQEGWPPEPRYMRLVQRGRKFDLLRLLLRFFPFDLPWSTIRRTRNSKRLVFMPHL